jgi:hypothetical protein
LRARLSDNGVRRAGRSDRDRARPYRRSLARQVREEDRGARTPRRHPEGLTQRGARAHSSVNVLAREPTYFAIRSSRRFARAQAACFSRRGLRPLVTRGRGHDDGLADALTLPPSPSCGPSPCGHVRRPATRPLRAIGPSTLRPSPIPPARRAHRTGRRDRDSEFSEFLIPTRKHTPTRNRQVLLTETPAPALHAPFVR